MGFRIYTDWLDHASLIYPKLPLVISWNASPDAVIHEEGGTQLPFAENSMLE